MNLFEIELDDKFKIHSSEVFLIESDLKKYYNLNTLNDTINDDIQEHLKKYEFKIHQDLFVVNNFKYKSDEIINIFLSDIYESNINSNKYTLYPEWLLFLIAIKKKKVKSIDKNEFHKHLEYFKYIAEIRYKKYIKRNLKNYICFEEYKELPNIKTILHTSLLEYLKESEYETNELYDYLNFLYRFYQELKDNEKYKLMWNLEPYIEETIYLLLNKQIPIRNIYEEVYRYMRGTYSVLHEIYMYKPLYIEESEPYFRLYLPKINKLFDTNIDMAEFIAILTKNDKHEDVLFSYLELIKRLNANKKSEITMGAMIKSIVLGVEEIIKDYIQEKKLIKCLKTMSLQKKLFDSQIIYEGKYSNGDELLELLDSLIKEEELIHILRTIKWNKKMIFSNSLIDMYKLNKCLSHKTSFEKYLAIYSASRNYLAHYNIDMKKFFWGIDGERRIISSTIDAVIIILYRVEIMREEALLLKK